MSIISDSVRDMRKARGMSQQELADASGISRWSVTQFENGKATISVDKLVDICTALGAELTIKAEE